MNDYRNKKIGFAFLYLVFVVCLTFTVLPGWIPLLRNSWILLALVFVVSVVLSKGYYKQNYILAWYFYIGVVFINSIAGDVYFANWIAAANELFIWIVPPAILYYAINNHQKFSMVLLLCIAFILLFEGFSTLSMDLVYPGVVRRVVIQFVIERDYSVFYPYYRLGMASYSFTHAIAILIPPLLYVLKDKTNKNIIRVFTALLLIMCLFLVYLSGSTTALILGVMALILSLLSREGDMSRNRSIVFIVTIIALPFALSDTILTDFLNFLDNIFAGTHFSSKVTDFIDLAETGNASGDIAARESLYLKSIEQWTQNPLLGSNDRPGHHSAIFDRLSSLGLVGSIPLLCFLFSQIKYTINKISNKARIYYYEGLYVGLALLFLKDSDDWETFLMLFLVMPLIIYVNDSNIFKKNKYCVE